MRVGDGNLGGMGSLRPAPGSKRQVAFSGSGIFGRGVGAQLSIVRWVDRRPPVPLNKKPAARVPQWGTGGPAHQMEAANIAGH
jgi:hypothetical protein